jgi:glucose/arabinose dehydrogenase
MRGSWNRNPPVGYEVVRIRFGADGRPVGMEPFVRGWLIEDGAAHFGRLMGLAQAADGSLLVGDDSNGVIYRISYGAR